MVNCSNRGGGRPI